MSLYLYVTVTLRTLRDASLQYRAKIECSTFQAIANARIAVRHSILNFAQQHCIHAPRVVIKSNKIKLFNCRCAGVVRRTSILINIRVFFAKTARSTHHRLFFCALMQATLQHSAPTIWHGVYIYSVENNYKDTFPPK